MEQRNLLLAIVLSVGILIGFQFLFEKYYPVQQPGPQSTQTQPSPAAPPASTAPPPAATQGAAPAPGAASTPGAAPAGAAAGGAETREQALAQTPRVKIDTPRLHGSIALKGGRLDDLSLAAYRETTDPNSPAVVLLWPTGTKDPYFAQFGWVGQNAGVKLPGTDTLWTASGGPLTPQHPVTLTWDNGEGLVFTRTISVDTYYMFTVQEAVKNTGTAPVSLASYGLISRTGTPQVSGYYILFEGMIGELGG
ncbi:MAG TPA: membrane protein insertase YidC, partial [Stellaceae bacterium]|nr:membrane protein insertase YidC [Stellaceae bacterium]